MRKGIVAVVSLAVLVFAGNAGAQTCAMPPSGMVGWWPGDGNPSDIVGGHTGTLSGNVVYTPGQVGQAFRFDGATTTFVSVSNPSDSSLEPTAVSVDAWVRANGTPGYNRYIVAKGADGCRAASYAFYTSGWGLAFYIFNGSSFVLSPNAGNIWDNQWHHIAGTFDGSHVRLYVDGNEIGGGTATTISIGYGLPDHNDLFIGAYWEPNHPCFLPFRGDIDEVEVFDRALTLPEIQAIHSAGSLGKLKRVDINIKPGSEPNSINTCSQGTTPVTIWGSACLDVNTISPGQLTLASKAVKTVGKSNRTLCSFKDVGGPDGAYFDNLNPNPDGELDLTCHFYTFELDLSDTSSTADVVITGCDDPSGGCQAGDSGFYVITGTDSVNIVKDCP